MLYLSLLVISPPKPNTAFKVFEILKNECALVLNSWENFVSFVSSGSTGYCFKDGVVLPYLEFLKMAFHGPLDALLPC